jgi:uncharacterized protein
MATVGFFFITFLLQGLRRGQQKSPSPCGWGFGFGRCVPCYRRARTKAPAGLVVLVVRLSMAVMVIGTYGRGAAPSTDGLTQAPGCDPLPATNLGETMRLLAFAAVAAAMLTGASAAGNVPAPSFDCAKAKTPQEKAICSDAELAGADAALAHRYGQVISANPAYAEGLRSAQRSWLKDRQTCTGARAVACLKDRYERRLAELRGASMLACAKPVLNGTAFTVSCIAPNTPQKMKLTVAGSKGDFAELKNLTIARDGAAPQSFKLDGQYYFDNLADSLIALIDVNFDGFVDVRLAVGTSAGPNSEFSWWLFDPKAGRFATSPIGEQLSGFEVWTDPKDKTVSVNARGSCCDWGTSTYIWNAGALKLVKTLDSGMFSAIGLPGMDGFEHMICGEQTSHYNDAGLITRIDLALDGAADSQCEKDDLAAQANVLDTIKRAKGLRIEAKDRLHFAILFDTPRKPGE